MARSSVTRSGKQAGIQPGEEQDSEAADRSPSRSPSLTSSSTSTRSYSRPGETTIPGDHGRRLLLAGRPTVRLDDGSRVDFGTWLEIPDEDFRTAWQTWNFPEYADLAVEGYLANSIDPWGRFPHVLAKATIRDVDEVPVLTSCPDLDVMRIIDGSGRGMRFSPLTRTCWTASPDQGGASPSGEALRSAASGRPRKDRDRKDSEPNLGRGAAGLSPVPTKRSESPRTGGRRRAVCRPPTYLPPMRISTMDASNSP